jgi:hypothetical protein
MFLSLAFFFINAVYASDLTNLRVPVGDIARVKKALDKYHRLNKYITRDPETGKLTLHLFSDFEEAFTRPYKEAALTLNKIVARSIKSQKERIAFEERFAKAYRKAAKESRRKVIKPSSLIAAYRKLFNVFRGHLREDHCRELAEYYNLNENFLAVIERIKEQLGVDAIEITIVARGVGQPMQMFIEKPSIKKKLNEEMSVTIKALIANTFIFEDGVFRGKLKEPFSVEKDKFVPPDALFLGDERDAGYGLRYYVNINAGVENLDKVLRQLVASEEVAKTDKSDAGVQRALQVLRSLEGINEKRLPRLGEKFYVDGEEVRYVGYGGNVRVYEISGFSNLVFKVFRKPIIFGSYPPGLYHREKKRMKKIERHLGSKAKKIKIDSFWLTLIPKTAAYDYFEGFIIQEKVQNLQKALNFGMIDGKLFLLSESKEKFVEQRDAIIQFYKENHIININADLKKANVGVRINSAIGPGEVVNIDFGDLRLFLREEVALKKKALLNRVNSIKKGNILSFI